MVINMSKQVVKMLDASQKNNSVSHKMDKILSKADHENIVKETKLIENSNENNNDKITSSGFEFFTRLSYCQAMLYKTWVESSDKASSILSLTKSDNKKEITSLHIGIYEDAFTNLFKSSEYASNLGKLLNSAMDYVKVWKFHTAALSNVADHSSENNNQDTTKNEVN